MLYEQQNYGQFYNPNEQTNFNNNIQGSSNYPGVQSNANNSNFREEEDYENEPPLLEELGINFSHIVQRTLVVLNPLKETTEEVLQDTDLAGPLVFCLTFGSLLMLAGKIQFNYIYGLGILSSILMYFLLNMLSPNGVSATCVISVLGYCLLPICVLAALGVFSTLANFQGYFITAFIIFWCSASSSNLFVRALHLQHQIFLVAYPCGLVYSAFALLTIF